MVKLFICTTVPETLTSILRGQPRYLSGVFDVNLVTSPGASFNRLSVEGVRVYPIPMRRQISIFADLFSLLRMILLFYREKPDIVHSYTPKAGFICMLAAFITRVPVRIHTFTGLIWPTRSGFLKLLLVTIDRLICYCSTVIVAESEGVRCDLQSVLSTKLSIQVIGSGNIAGVDLEYFNVDNQDVQGSGHVLRTSYSIPRGAFVFVFIGRLHPDKGISELLEAFLLLPLNCHLLIVGAEDDTLPLNAGDLNVLSSHERIHWLGFKLDIRPALLASNVLVLPSYREGFPNVILQAAAMNLPVIATNVSGSNEFVITGTNGWIVKVKDRLDLCAAMRAALTLPTDRLVEMGVSGRAKVVNSYERSHYLTLLVRFYRSLI